MTERLTSKLAVYVIVIKENKIALLRRENTGLKDGFLTLPSGHVERGETIVECAQRELMEESGIDSKIEDLKVVHIMYRPSSTNIYVDFYVETKEFIGEGINTEPEKCSEFLWCDLDKLPEDMIESVRNAIENYKKQILYSEYWEKDV